MRSNLSILALVAIGLAACAADQSALPTETSPGNPGSTTRPGPGVDTTSTPGFPGNVTIAGTVYLAGTGVPTDTGVVSTAAPLAGVTVRFLRNMLVNGQAAQLDLGTVVSGANGEFSATNLPGGYYVVEGLTASGAVATYSLVATTNAVTQTSLWLPAP